MSEKTIKCDGPKLKDTSYFKLTIKTSVFSSIDIMNEFKIDINDNPFSKNQ